MDVYLRASNGTYLAVDRSQDPVIIASNTQANFKSLFSINVYDPDARHSLSFDETPLRNGNMVTLHSSDGSMLAPDPYGMLHPNGAKSGKVGYNIFCIYKLGGAMEDPICPGDLIALRLVPPAENAASPWMSIDCDGSIVNFCSGHQQITDTEQFQILSPVDLRDFLIEYDDLYNEVVAHIALTGPALPGGHAVRLESPDGAEFFPTTDIIVEDKKPWFVIPMTQAAQHLTPAARRKIAVRAVFQTTGTCVEQPFVVEGDRALFMQMEIQKVTKVPPKSSDQKTRTFDVDVQLYLTSDRRVKSDSIPMNVTLHAGPDGVVQHLTQAWSRLTYEHAIPFRFSIDQPPADCEEPIRSTISAQYTLNGVERCSRFEVRISRKGILIDPR